MSQRFHRLATQIVPQPAGYLAEPRFANDLAVALARPAGHDNFEESTGTGRHRADAVREDGRLVKRMRDQENGCPGAPPQPQHLVAHEQTRLRIESAKRL